MGSDGEQNSSKKDLKAERITLRSSNGTFDFKDGPPFALSYLRTYYMPPPTADEVAVIRFLVEEFKKSTPTGKFIEIGCGPTIHHILPFVPHVSEIHMADYLDENLEQVRIWLAGSPDAHSWDHHTELTLELEGGDSGPKKIDERNSLTRKKVTNLMLCDLKSATPKQVEEQYDVVGCFYCAEEVGVNDAEWRKVVGRVAAYLRPGGTLFMSALAGMNSYNVTHIDGTTVEYPCANVSESSVRSCLAELGFLSDSQTIETLDIEHPDCGLTGTIIFSAVKG